MKNLGNKFKFLFGILISVFFLFIVIKKMDFKEVFQVIQSIKIIYLIPIFIANITFYLMFAYRWQLLFTNFKTKPKFSSVLKVSIIGYMGNNIMPARLGELLRLYLMKKKEKVKHGATLATVVLEKGFDGIALMLMFILVLFFSTVTKEHLYALETISYKQLKMWGYIVSAIYLVLMGILFLFRTQIKFFVKLHNKLFVLLFNKISRKVGKFLFSFAGGLSAFKNFRDMFNIFLSSLLVWICHAFIIYFCLKACSIEIPFAGAFFVLVFIGVACMIPSSPGFVGTLEFFAILGLSCYGVDKDRALGFALLYHVLEMLPVTIIGIYLFIKESVHLKEVEAVNSNVN
jgi:glycosyltransferase 2 family protein